MGKLDALRADVEEAIKKFEDCQDAYATDMFAFLGKEQIYTHKLQQVACVCVCVRACVCAQIDLSPPFPLSQLVKQQLSYYKQATASLEHMLPHFDKKMGEYCCHGNMIQLLCVHVCTCMYTHITYTHVQSLPSS